MVLTVGTGRGMVFEGLVGCGEEGIGCVEEMWMGWMSCSNAPVGGRG